MWTWSPWTLQGCFSDNSTRMLPYCLSTSGAITQSSNCAGAVNTARCQAVAAANGYNVIGLQYYGQCFMCNNCNWAAIGSAACSTPAWPACDPVSGGSGCGGAYVNQVWTNTWNLQGFFGDTWSRALPSCLSSSGTITQATGCASGVTTARCQAAAAAAGYNTVALQSGGQCYMCSGCNYAVFGAAASPTTAPAYPSCDPLSGGGGCGGGWVNMVWTRNTPLASMYTIQNKASGYCLADGSGGSLGIRSQVAACSGGATQLWLAQPVDTSGFVDLVNGATGAPSVAVVTAVRAALR